MNPADQDRVDSLAARQRMIDVAERLFAEQGIEAVSMRTVTLEAGQRNNSAVAYHFGSRDGLVQGILDHRSGPIDGRRCALIDALEEAGSAVAVEDAVRVFVQPLAETHHGEAGWYLRFLADATVDPETYDAQQAHQPPGIVWVNRKLASLLSELPHDVLRRRMRWMVLIALRVLADHERMAVTATAPTRARVHDITPDLVHTLTALLTGRPSESR